jgi:membrane-associated phospholipid phosphatase
MATMTFRLNSLPALASLAFVTSALVVSDRDTWKATRRAFEQSGFVHSVNDVFVTVGDGAYHLGLAAGFAVYGFAADDQRALRTASQATEAILACGVAVQLLKHISGRESPVAATSGSGAWHLFPNPREYHSNQTRYYAFPSGHIATGMATVTVLIENYPEATWLRPVGYTTVGLIGLSLVARNYHWYSDLPLGIALGYSFGKLAAHPEGLGSVSSDVGSASGLSIAPAVTSSGGGVVLTLSF